MAIRHFRGRGADSGQLSRSSSSSASEDEPENHAAEEPHKEPPASSDSSDSDEDSSSSSDEDSDDGPALVKPVFLKRKRPGSNQGTQDLDDDDNSNANSNANDNQEPNPTLVRAAHFATATHQEKLLASNTFDTSIAAQVMALDDTDDLDPEQELHDWQQRHHSRIAREREKKLQAQLEIEEQEMRRSTNLSPDAESTTTTTTTAPVPTSSHTTTKPLRKPSSNPARLSKSNMQLPNIHPSPSSHHDTEYSYIE